MEHKDTIHLCDRTDRGVNYNVKADSHVAVYRYEYDVRSMVLSSKKHNYCFDFKACTVKTDAEIPQSGNQLSLMLHKLVFLECHWQFSPVSVHVRIVFV